MDLLDLSTTKKFNFINPKDKKETDIVIELSYPDTRLGRRNMLATQRKIFELMQDEANKDEDGKLKAELMDEINIDYLASMIVSWENITLNKKKLECNFENAKKLLDNELILQFVKEGFLGMGKLLN